MVVYTKNIYSTLPRLKNNIERLQSHILVDVASLATLCWTLAFESSIKHSGDVSVSRAGEVKLLDSRLVFIILPKSACAPRYNTLKDE